MMSTSAPRLPLAVLDSGHPGLVWGAWSQNARVAGEEIHRHRDLCGFFVPFLFGGGSTGRPYSSRGLEKGELRYAAVI